MPCGEIYGTETSTLAALLISDRRRITDPTPTSTLDSLLDQKTGNKKNEEYLVERFNLLVKAFAARTAHTI
jgi:hypothetical protein